MAKLYVTGYPWHVTYLWLAATDEGLAAIEFERTCSFAAFKSSFEHEVCQGYNGILRGAIAQLDGYFRGNVQDLDMPVIFLRGSEFQRSVWQRVRAIPYGRTKTYGEIARELGVPAAVRAVGAANGANPLPIVIPCHRVLRADGGLGGYSGGLEIKDALLRLEGAIL
ncbi:methylated-DNA--[protein]-cysteine S-methyltransferase [candidate division KSB1 bacterium]|nr:methylated-DNA--[protein]-cysteine S-methyltransferase [candidate division KSB1 bacterium]